MSKQIKPTLRVEKPQQEDWEKHICPTCGEKHIDIECPEYEFSGVSKTLYDFFYDVDSDHGTMSLEDGIRKYSKKLSSERQRVIDEVRSLLSPLTRYCRSIYRADHSDSEPLQEMLLETDVQEALTKLEEDK